MARSPITWRNINAPSASSSGSPGTGANLLTQGFDRITDGLQGLVSNRQDRLKREYDTQVQNNTRAALAEIDGIKDVAGLQQAQQNGLSIDAFRQRFGNDFDYETVNKHLAGAEGRLRDQYLQRDAYGQKKAEIDDRSTVQGFESQLAGFKDMPEGAANEAAGVLRSQIEGANFANEANRTALLNSLETTREKSYTDARKAVTERQNYETGQREYQRDQIVRGTDDLIRKVASNGSDFGTAWAQVHDALQNSPDSELLTPEDFARVRQNLTGQYATLYGLNEQQQGQVTATQEREQRDYTRATEKEQRAFEQLQKDNPLPQQYKDFAAEAGEYTVDRVISDFASKDLAVDKSESEETGFDIFNKANAGRFKREIDGVIAEVEQGESENLEEGLNLADADRAIALRIALEKTPKDGIFLSDNKEIDFSQFKEKYKAALRDVAKYSKRRLAIQEGRTTMEANLENLANKFGSQTAQQLNDLRNENAVRLTGQKVYGR